jgi:hypothetical protein
MLKPFQVSVKYFLANTKTRTDDVKEFVDEALKELGVAFTRGTWITLKQAMVSASDAEHDNELFLSNWVNSKQEIAMKKR